MATDQATGQRNVTAGRRVSYPCTVASVAANHRETSVVVNEEISKLLMARWQSGDSAAADELFRRYADRLAALVRSRLSSKLARRLDPEDVLQSAYRSFFAGARAGRYELKRGGDLWRLLVAITLHKLQDQADYHGAGKRNINIEKP